MVPSVAAGKLHARETIRVTVRPHQTVLRVTRHRYPMTFATWNAHIDGDPQIFAEPAGQDGAWLYGHGMVVRVMVRHDGRWAFRIVNTSSRRHRLVVTFDAPHEKTG